MKTQAPLTGTEEQPHLYACPELADRIEELIRLGEATTDTTGSEIYVFTRATTQH